MNDKDRKKLKKDADSMEDLINIEYGKQLLDEHKKLIPTYERISKRRVAGVS